MPTLVKSGYGRLVPDRLVTHMRAMLDADEAQLYARDPSDPDVLIVVAASGGDPEAVGSRVPADRGAAGMALRSGQPVTAPGADTAELSAAAAPVMRDGGIAGVVSVAVADTSRAFSLKDWELLCEVAELAGGALDRPARHRKLERTADAQAAALATGVEMWDAGSGHHAEEVTRLVRKCGERLGLSSSELLELELAAMLHDVGKIRVPRELLTRSGPLSDEERQVVQLHAAWSAELLAQVPGFAAVALIVRHHHERVDGGGHPSRLAGDRIPLAARIVAAADAYEAMTAGRSYRNAIPPANAVEELRVHAGQQFDPRVVDALADVVGCGGLVVPLPEPAPTAA